MTLYTIKKVGGAAAPLALVCLYSQVLFDNLHFIEKVTHEDYLNNFVMSEEFLINHLSVDIFSEQVL